MNNYTPIFGKIVDSSLWEEPLHVRVLFVTMLVRQDWDHVVRIEDHHLRRAANLSDEEVMDGLRVLSEPDRKSKFPQEFEGRRIEKVEDGWLILNGERYQEAMRKANEKARWARNKREQRARDAALKQVKASPEETGIPHSLMSEQEKSNELQRAMKVKEWSIVPGTGGTDEP